MSQNSTLYHSRVRRTAATAIASPFVKPHKQLSHSPDLSRSDDFLYSAHDQRSQHSLAYTMTLFRFLVSKLCTPLVALPSRKDRCRGKLGTSRRGKQTPDWSWRRSCCQRKLTRPRSPGAGSPCRSLPGVSVENLSPKCQIRCRDTQRDGKWHAKRSAWIETVVCSRKLFNWSPACHTRPTRCHRWATAGKCWT